MNRYLQKHWQDTKYLEEELGVSNRKILKILTDEKMIYKDPYGFKKVTQIGTANGVRWQERQCYYNRNSRATTSSHFYTVIQLNSKGVEFVRQKLQEQVAA
jgi:hypothetical protein